VKDNIVSVCGSWSLARLFGSRTDEVRGEWLSLNNGKSGEFSRGRMRVLFRWLGLQYECSITGYQKSYPMKRSAGNPRIIQEGEERYYTPNYSVLQVGDKTTAIRVTGKRKQCRLFISVINQLGAQKFCFTISLFHASTCFEHMCSLSGGQNCITQPLVSSNWNKWVVQSY